MDDPMSVDPDPLADPRALPILNSEMQSLMAARALSYNEAFSRATMFLSFLSATLIVIGFLVGTQGFVPDILPIVVVLLLADLYIGAATVGRLIDASAEELRCVRGMNRIRYAYREMAPGLASYFVSGFHDDATGVLATYGYAERDPSRLSNIVHGLTTAIGMVATIDAMIFGALCSLVVVGLQGSLEAAVLVGLAGFILGTIYFAIIGMRSAIGRQGRAESRFPTPGDRS